MRRRLSAEHIDHATHDASGKGDCLLQMPPLDQAGRIATSVAVAREPYALSRVHVTKEEVGADEIPSLPVSNTYLNFRISNACSKAVQ